MLAGLLFAVAAGACAPSKDGQETPPQEVEASVEIGLPAGDDGLDFEPLEPGAELRLQTFGQGGTHIMLGVRCIGFGTRAYVRMILTNLETGERVVTPPPPRPQLLYCHDDGLCDLVPILVGASGIAEPGEERHGLEVEVTAEVHNDAGARAEASQHGVLNSEDL